MPAIIDYINGLPLETESNYIFAQIAKCRLIPVFCCSFLELGNVAVAQQTPKLSNWCLANVADSLGDVDKKEEKCK